MSHKTAGRHRGGHCRETRTRDPVSWLFLRPTTVSNLSPEGANHHELTLIFLSYCEFFDDLLVYLMIVSLSFDDCFDTTGAVPPFDSVVLTFECTLPSQITCLDAAREERD